MTVAKNGIAGVVVLFNPPDCIWDNMRTYALGLELLIVVDNSPEVVKDLKTKSEDFPGLVYVKNPKNLGIAVAMNQGAAIAIERGFGWLLTMDQDSRFDAGAFHALAAAREGSAGVGILVPRHSLRDGDDFGRKEGWEDVRVAMTSGNLLNLGVYQKVGPFLEFLFIDYVDHEYCLRLAGKGFKVRRINTAVLRHSLGKLEVRNVIGFQFQPTHHSALRRYYMTRNRLYIMTRFPSILLPEAYAWAKELMKLFLFEKNKTKKLAFMLRGAVDFSMGKFGFLDEEAGNRQGKV